MRTRDMAGLVCLVALCGNAAVAAEPPAADAANRVQWFTEAKFGMFMHWGLYSHAAGVWKEKKYYGIGEWLMNRAKIPVREYETLAASFNPVKFDAAAWVRTAKQAGMRYIVITAKHHDGFAMFKSAASPFNIVDASPFKRDPLKELADECHKEGLRICFYYSQYQDWHEPGGGGNSWDFPNNKEKFGEYFEAKCKTQIKELLTNYGPIGLIWFDTPGSMTAAQSKELLDMVHTLQPQCLVSSRVGNNVGDYTDLGDHELPPEVIKTPFESLFTHNDSWGYVWYDQNWRSPKELVRMLAQINGKGGNFLLNIGPQGDGALPAMSLRVLRQVGEWVAKNKESVYGTSYTAFPPLTWGDCTTRPGKLYLHVFDWPKDATLRVPGLACTIRSVRLLDGGKELAHARDGGDVFVTLPREMPDPFDTVVVVDYEGDLKVAPVRTLMEGCETTFLALEAQRSGAAKVRKLSWMEEFGDWKHANVVEGWKTDQDAVRWAFRAPKAGEYWVELDYAYPSKSKRQEGVIRLGGNQQLLFETKDTGDKDSHFQPHRIGVVTIPAGAGELSVHPMGAEDGFMKLRNVKLIPFE